MSEIFKQVTGYPDYQVSSEGRMIGSKGYILNPSIGNHGFRKVTLCKRYTAEKKNFLLHRLIAQEFIPNPNNYEDVDHKNFDKTDNRIENLEWTNDSINNKKLFDAGRSKNNFKTVGRIIHLNSGKAFSSMLEASKELDLPYASVYEVVHGRQDNVRGNRFSFVANNS